MNTPAQRIVQLVLTLAKGGDLELLPSLVSGDALTVAQDLARLVEDFEYLRSAEFADLAQARSVAYVGALRRKYSEPTQVAEKREAFYAAIRGLLAHSDIERHLPPGSELVVQGLRAKLKALHAV